MANPLQPACIKVIEQEYNGYVVKVVAASKSGHMDIVAGIAGEFYGFEVKWKNDKPSELQKDKINKCIDCGNKAYFIRSVQQLREILDKKILPVKYELSNHIEL